MNRARRARQRYDSTSPWIRRVHPSSITKLVASLHEAPSADDRERAVRSELAAIGFSWLEYSRIRRHDGAIQPSSFLRAYAPPEWTAAYRRNRSWEVDDRLQGTPCNGVPRLWTVDEVDRAARRPVQHRASRSKLDRLVSCGVGSGMMGAEVRTARASGTMKR